MSAELPSTEDLFADVRAIILTNMALSRELGSMARPMMASPVWEPVEGEVVVRASSLPRAFARLYFEHAGRETLQHGGLLWEIASLLPLFVDNPSLAEAGLADTERVWCEDGAPVRRLGLPYRPYFRVLTLLIADAARKLQAELSDLEWIASLGLDVEGYRKPELDPPKEEIVRSMKSRVHHMWNVEAGWMRETRLTGTK